MAQAGHLIWWLFFALCNAQPKITSPVFTKTYSQTSAPSKCQLGSIYAGSAYAGPIIECRLIVYNREFDRRDSFFDSDAWVVGYACHVREPAF